MDCTGLLGRANGIGLALPTLALPTDTHSFSHEGMLMHECQVTLSAGRLAGIGLALSLRRRSCRPLPPQVLLIGKSRAVLDGAEQILRARGFGTSSTNRFDEVLRDFDVTLFDLVVFGGQVPADLEAQLTAEIGKRQPRMVYLKGLSGIPGLIADQVSGALTDECPKLLAGPSYNADTRSIEMSLEAPADVNVTVWWVTSFVPPDPKSTSRRVLDRTLPAGNHVVHVPPDVPDKAAFASVRIEDSVTTIALTSR